MTSLDVRLPILSLFCSVPVLSIFSLLFMRSQQVFLGPLLRFLLSSFLFLPFLVCPGSLCESIMLRCWPSRIIRRFSL